MTQLFGLQHRGDGEIDMFLDCGDGSQRTFFCFENATFRERCDSIPSLKQHQHQ